MYALGQRCYDGGMTPCIPGDQFLTNCSRRLAGALLALVLVAGGARGQAPASVRTPLSLAEARRIALERNADFRVARIQVDAALAQLRAAREFPNPTLGLSTAKISTDGTPESTPMGNSLLNRAYDSIVSLSQLIQISKRGLIRDSANAGVHVAEFQKEDAQRLLLQAVTQAYVAALSSQEQARVLTESAAALRRQAEIAAHRYHAGDLSKSDQGRIEIAADQDELGAQSEVAAAKSAVVALESLLGNPDPDGSTELSDSLSQLSQAAAPGLEDMALSDRPDIAAAEAGVEQAETNLKLQRRERVPDVTVSLQFERNPPAQPDTIGVGLSLPLPLWNQYTGEILAAQAARNQAEAHLDSVRVQAAADVSAARVAYREARDRARRYEQSLLPKSAEVTKSVVYAYEKGGAALIDLLDAQRNDNSIRQAAVQADADAAAAAAALLAALGRL
jgi:outer membrane protein, heavy metal efflux system